MAAETIRQDSPGGRSAAARTLAVSALLALAVLVVYAPVRHHDFVEFDDPLYVTENSHVQQGLTGSTLVWAFTSRDAFLFHPLTWLSHMLDVELWGAERAGPMALTSAAIHAANGVLLLLLLHALTGRFWPSAFVAALFALHPLRVESVAWISERKDVLSGLFFVLTLWAYAGYARRGGAGRYALTAGLMLLGLLSKSLLVTLPAVLLLLDYWPLERVGRVPLRRLVLEKIPLLALALAVAITSVLMMESAPSVWGEDSSLLTRVSKAGVAYVFYLGKTIWPTRLAIVYPDPAQQGQAFFSAWQIAGAYALLIGITGLALATARRQRAIVVGWLWYLVTMLPMSGIVPFGIRVMNDRYTYLPMIGLAIALAFGVADALPRTRLTRRALATLAVALLVSCAALSWRQVGVWRDSLTLFDHALAVTERNAIVHFVRGIALAKSDRPEEAQAELRTALEIHPEHAGAHSSLGWLLEQSGRRDEAIVHYRRAVELQPFYTRAQVNLANALAAQGDADASLALLREAVEGNPRHADARYWLGLALVRAGQPTQAEREYRAALDLEPGHAWSHGQLASLLEERGREAEALFHYRGALAKRPEDRDALRGVAWILATSDDADLRSGDEAVRAAEALDALTDRRSPPARYVLAAAYAEAGRFAAAVAALEEVLAQLTAADRDWAVELRRCVALYAAGLSYRPPGPPARE